MKIALFYGSTTGNTEDIAEIVQATLGSDTVDLFDVAEESLTEAAAYDFVILGIPTWDYGEIQSEWEDVWDDVDEIDFNGKAVALYGLGDQVGYGEWFLDAMGLLHDKVLARGGRMIGYWPTEGYQFEASKALTKDGKQFVGLALDEDCQNELTDQRVKQWLEQITAEFKGA
ncbi:MAG: flavodoxin FldB [Motiliproteus sp.]|nr:flavodoxin FldB [Motiliproteus sp.]MCW9051909.1 flavodoxin FldB [Motiliproteus sp.]